MTLSFIV